MGQNDLKIMINEYFDGELDKEKETLLFTRLSLDDEARDYFKDLNMIKTATEQTLEEFPFGLEERIMYSVGSMNDKKKF
ncbi:MAG: hypothetical protein JEY94_15535 [Melioribacteraceae bacterium]|nr:hypothetical protein [Melioribacteraceae bacterium]